MAAEASRPLAPDAVFGALMLRVQQRLDALVASGCEVILRDWTRRDALAGLRIEVLIPDGRRLAGRYSGLAPDGRLALTDDSGQSRLFWSGDIVRIFKAV
jgi:BirA family biotin operon repressor/biotin-[acetyl-CoA-carboxylase] ligase